MVDINSVLAYSRDLNILYVEDDKDIQEQTYDTLEGFFNILDTADDGEMALIKYKDYFENNCDYYDLIISDINMPKKDGIDFSSDVLKINSEQKILIISAHNEVHYLNDLINLGVTGFLLKPVDINQLLISLYRTTQAISDRKNIKAYYNEIDRLDRELVNKNSELERSLRLLNTNHKKSSIQATSLNKNNDLPKKTKKSEEDSRELLDALYYELPELTEICTELDNKIIDIVTHEKYDEIPEVITLFARFGASLSAFYIFAPLQEAILSLVNAFEDNELPDDRDFLKNGVLLLESLIYSLNIWVREWDESRSENISFYDASIITDTQSVISYWTHSEDEDDSELEFF